MEKFEDNSLYTKIDNIFKTIYESDLSVIKNVSDTIDKINNTTADDISLDNNVIIKNDLQVIDYIMMTSNDSSKSNININNIDLYKYIYNLVYPVGSFYIQYPDANASVDKLDIMFPIKYSPSTLYGGIWELQWNTENVFFRTEGGNSNISRDSTGIQKDDIKQLKGSWPRIQIDYNGIKQSEAYGYWYAQATYPPPGHRYDDSSLFQSTVESKNEAYKINVGHKSDGTAMGISYLFDSSLQSLSSNNETRVKNRLFRIWKKTSN